MNSTQMSSHRHTCTAPDSSKETTFSQHRGAKQDSVLAQILPTLGQISWQDPGQKEELPCWSQWGFQGNLLK